MLAHLKRENPKLCNDSMSKPARQESVKIRFNLIFGSRNNFAFPHTDDKVIMTHTKISSITIIIKCGAKLN